MVLSRTKEVAPCSELNSVVACFLTTSATSAWCGLLRRRPAFLPRCMLHVR